ncbi:MAG: GNAT family N-acetyltransferase [bacterium]|nr:GNAT family N-acetyltransferase [bacterium]
MSQPVLADSLKNMTSLRIGADVVIRPIELTDIDATYSFFSTLSKADRNYLRFDVTKRSEIENRIRAIEGSDNLNRLIVLVGNQVIATGVLELQSDHWKRHVAEMRMIIGRKFRRKGLGKLIARELFMLAMRKKVEEIVVQLMRPQMAAYSIVKGLGFKEEAVLKDYVRDLDGKKQDLIVMHCDMKTLWQEMEHYVTELDWQRHR